MAAIVSTSERLAFDRAASSSTASADGAVAQHVPVDEAHHIERRVVDRRVVAVPLHGRHRHVGTLQARQDPVLATHVVGARQHVTERWSAQDEAGSVGAADAIGEVRMPAGDGGELERRSGSGDVRDEPFGDIADVDPGHGHTLHWYPLHVLWRSLMRFRG